MRSKPVLASAAILAAGLAAAGPLAAQTTPQAAPPAAQASAAARDARGEIERALGQVPGMFRFFPDAGIPGAWAEFREFQMGQATALNGKVKELIGPAVSAQVPCTYCVYFHTRAARLNGATDEEIPEAVGMAAVTRHWSTVLNGSGQDPAEFRREADAVFARVEAAAAAQPQQQPRR
jgi:AhpD family alkylhydroperoxidase